MPRQLTLVTHLFPHRDDVAGLWLLQRFDPKYRDVNLMFVPTGSNVRLDSKHVGIGTGRGLYDEHKGDVNDSAASLVWKDLKKKKLLPKGLKGEALAELIESVRHGDLGWGIGQPNHFRNDTKILQTIAGLPGQDSITATRWGYTLMDALLALYMERTTAIRAIQRGIKFQTQWGRGIAIKSEVLPGMASTISAELGYALVALEHPSHRYLHVRSNPNTKTNLTRLYNEVRKIDGDSAWYLHHSKRLLIHGDLVAPTDLRSKLKLKDLVKLIKKICN
jgi:hypothetical protein